VSDESTAVLQGQLERALTGDAGARRRLLELTRDRLLRHARRLLHGRYARLEPFAQTDDVVQQVYVKVLQNQDRFWVNADGEPVRSLAELFGHTSAWLRDVLYDLLRKACSRDDIPPRGPYAEGSGTIPACRWGTDGRPERRGSQATPWQFGLLGRLTSPLRRPRSYCSRAARPRCRWQCCRPGRGRDRRSRMNGPFSLACAGTTRRGPHSR
jgi:hypothetical protein